MNFIFKWQNNILRTSAASVSQGDIDKTIEGNDRNYVNDNLTCEIMENKPRRSRMWFL